GGDVVRSNVTAAFDERIDRFLASAASTLMLALAAMFVLFESTHESFVHLDCLSLATERRIRMQFAHRFAKPMLHEPCRLVGHLKRAMQLVGAKSLLAA